jgi:hypothetical protein
MQAALLLDLNAEHLSTAVMVSAISKKATLLYCHRHGLGAAQVSCAVAAHVQQR